MQYIQQRETDNDMRNLPKVRMKKIPRYSGWVRGSGMRESIPWD